MAAATEDIDLINNLLCVRGASAGNNLGFVATSGYKLWLEFIDITDERPLPSQQATK
jgi:hypothetical protein